MIPPTHPPLRTSSSTSTSTFGFTSPRRWLCCRLLLTSVAAVCAANAQPANAAAAATAPQEQGTEDTVLQLSVGSSLDGAARIERAILDQGAEQLDILRVNPAFDARDPKRILVAVGGEDYAYSIRVTATRDGTTPLGSAIVSGCDCSETELVHAVLKELPEAVARYENEDSVAAPVEEDEPTAAPPAGEAPEPLHETDGPRGKAVGPLGWVGIAGMIGGAGLLVGGAVLLPKEETSGTQLQPTEKTYRTSGIGLLAGGGALVVAGAVALIVDQTVLKKKRRGNKRAHVSPAIGAWGAGLRVSGSF